eukprot:gene6662-7414_t
MDLKGHELVASERRDQMDPAKPNRSWFSSKRGTASDSLDEYIDKFEGKIRAKYYTPKKTNSPKPKSTDLFDEMERRSNNNTNANRSHDLLSWINSSYKDNIKSTCQPVYNQGGKSLAIGSQDELGSYIAERTDDQGIIGNDYNKYSNLPSPHESENEDDSDQDTIATELLLKSYTSGQQTQVQSQEINVHNYPNWVTSIDQATVSDLNEISDPRRLSSVSSLLKSSPPYAHPTDSKSHDTTGLTMDDTASIDTDVILQTSVYGEEPVNMGGNLHSPLFKDRKVQMILNDSRVKKKNATSNVLGRSVHSASSRQSSFQSPQSRDVLYAKQILNKHRGREVIGRTVQQISQYDQASQARSTSPQRSAIPSGRGKDLQTKQIDYQPISGEMRARKEIRVGNAVTKGMGRVSLNRRGRDASDTGVAKEVLPVNARQARRHENYMLRSSKDAATAGVGRDNARVNTDARRLFASKLAAHADQSSPRTSGYYSDMYLASPSTVPWSSNEEPRLRENMHNSSISIDTRPKMNNPRRESDFSESSVNTDRLTRQSPTGIRLKHQRSKTWASSSMQNAMPAAMSTPKYPYNEREFRKGSLEQGPFYYPREQSGKSGADMRPNSDTAVGRISTTSRTSRGNSSYGTKKSEVNSIKAKGSSPSLAARPRGELSNSPLQPYPRAQTTYREALPLRGVATSVVGRRGVKIDKPSSAVGEEISIASREITKPELFGSRNGASTNFDRFNADKVNYGAENRKLGAVKSTAPNGENYTMIPNGDYLNGDYDNDGNEMEDLNADESSLSETDPSSHNRTWPSLERYKRRITYIKSDGRRIGNKPQGWVEEKRSIPLRAKPNGIHEQASSYKASRTGYSRDPGHLEGEYKGRDSTDSSQWLSGNGFIPSDERVSSSMPLGFDQDTESTIADTDILLNQPPMPIVNASPSLSTVSGDASDDGSTVVSESQIDNHVPLYNDLPPRSSSRVSFAPDVNHAARESWQPSPLSTSALVNTRPSKITEDVTKYSNNQTKQGNYSGLAVHGDRKALKSDMLDSFIEDCMRNVNGVSLKENRMASHHNDKDSRSMKLSGREHPGTVETLKHMLLNLNGVASGGAANEMTSQIGITPAHHSTKKLSEIDDSEDETSSLPGEQSLSRAYHHLERLKSLINSRRELNSEC